MKKCPFCAELIQDQAVKCCYCREVLVRDEAGESPGLLRPRGVRRSLFVTFVLIIIAVSVFFFPAKRQPPRDTVIDRPEAAGEARPAPEAKPAAPSKIDIYLQAYPDYFGLTSGDQARQGKYWYQNKQAYPHKIFYFDTLEQLEAQKLDFTSGQGK
jgi:hypothetical protein